MTLPTPPNHFDLLLEALETARKQVCGYSGRTCDCKYGLVPSDMISVEAIACSHNWCEHTGCPEIRDLIAKTVWARRAHEFGPNHGCPRAGAAPVRPADTSFRHWRCNHCGQDYDSRGNPAPAQPEPQEQS